MYEFQSSYDSETSHLVLYYAEQEDIDNFIFPEDVKTLYIAGDRINTIELPQGVEEVKFSSVGLKSIKVPDSLKRLYVENNLLKELELPNNIEIVYAKRNLLEKLCFRGGNPTCLSVLKLSDNDRIQELLFQPPPCFEVINLKRCYGLRESKKIHPELLRVALECDQEMWLL